MRAVDVLDVSNSSIIIGIVIIVITLVRIASISTTHQVNGVPPPYIMTTPIASKQAPRSALAKIASA